MKFYKVMIMAALGLMLAAPRAEAQSIFSTSNLNMRAGPGSNFPIIGGVGQKSGLEILGCLNGWTWCDVNANGNRGWVSGDYLRGNRNNNAYPLSSVGSMLGVPNVRFDQDSYWRQHYASRDFYKRRYTPGYNHRKTYKKMRHDNGLHRGWYKNGHHPGRQDAEHRRYNDYRDHDRGDRDNNDRDWHDRTDRTDRTEHTDRTDRTDHTGRNTGGRHHGNYNE